ncbi:MAG: hypothetical protein LBG64_02555 [Pseudomonadales bacterium]|jgi:hypothetical protein|nr:hypothetical protein [Pseudomonadales bacterium]
MAGLINKNEVGNVGLAFYLEQYLNSIGALIEFNNFMRAVETQNVNDVSYSFNELVDKLISLHKTNSADDFSLAFLCGFVSGRIKRYQNDYNVKIDTSSAIAKLTENNFPDWQIIILFLL